MTHQYFVMLDGVPHVATRGLTAREHLAVQQYSPKREGDPQEVLLMVFGAAFAAFIIIGVITHNATAMFITLIGVFAAGSGLYWLSGSRLRTVRRLLKTGVLSQDKLHAELHGLVVEEIRTELTRRDLRWTDEQVAEAMSRFRLYTSLIEKARENAARGETAPDSDEASPQKMAEAIVNEELRHHEVTQKG